MEHLPHGFPLAHKLPLGHQYPLQHQQPQSIGSDILVVPSIDYLKIYQLLLL